MSSEYCSWELKFARCSREIAAIRKSRKRMGDKRIVERKRIYNIF
jgi:hypothetical protein